jgi:hypothetical protein
MGLEARMRAARITVCGRAAQSSFPLAPDELRQQLSQRFRDELRRLVLRFKGAGDGCLNFADRGGPFPSRAKSSRRESSRRVRVGSHGTVPLTSPRCDVTYIIVLAFLQAEKKNSAAWNQGASA